MTSAISKIDNDILSSIFDTITSEIPKETIPRTERPLTTIHVASQVCQWWRGLLLSSAPIWGRLIDLDCEKGLQSLEWMEEVARRARSAPLWIYGDVTVLGFKFEPPSYFIRLLESQWKQIEILLVRISSYDSKALANIYSHFLRPAPILKLFSVRFSDRQILDIRTPARSDSLFADYAPSLQAMSTGDFVYRSESSWLCNIREINPFPVHSTFTLKDIFDILQQTPLINTVRIIPERREYPHQIPQPHYPRLSLLNLTSIYVMMGLEVLAWFLDHITPGILSGLCLQVWDRQIPSMTNSTILSSLAKNLPLYLSGPFITNPSSIIILVISKSQFRVGKVKSRVPALSIHYSYGHLDVSRLFEVSIACYEDASNPQDWESLIGCLLDVLLASLGEQSSAVKMVTELWIPNVIEVQPTSIPKLHSLLDLFVNVQDIWTNEEYGHTLLTLSYLDEDGHNPDRPIVFPQLRTLHLWSTRLLDDIVYNDVTLFLIGRKKIGFPVATLDLTGCETSYYAQDLRDLEGVAGLEVVWKKKDIDYSSGVVVEETCNYICGSGHPERLIDLVDRPEPDLEFCNMGMGSDSDVDSDM